MNRIKALLQSKHSMRILTIGLIIIGFLLCGVGFSLVDNNIYKLNPYPTELITKEQVIPLGDINSLYLDVNRSDVIVESIEGNQIQILYEEKADSPLKIDVSNKSLSIESVDKIRIFNFNWMNFDNMEKPTIKLMIPSDYKGDFVIATAYGTIDIDDIKGIGEFTIENSHGEINVKDIESSTLSIINSYGYTSVSDVKSSGAVSVENHHNAIDIKNIEASDILITNAYGRISSKHLVSQNDITIENQHNDIDINESTAKNFYGDMAYSTFQVDSMKLENDFRITSKHGDVTLENLKSKNSHMETSYGTLEINDWISDNIYVEASHGDIIGNIIGKEADYHIISSVEHGNNNLSQERNPGKSKKLDITLSYGDLEVNFTN